MTQLVTTEEPLHHEDMDDTGAYDWLDDPDLTLEESLARLKKLQPALIDDSATAFGMIIGEAESRGAGSERIYQRFTSGHHGEHREHVS